MNTLILVISGVTLGATYALVALGFHLIFRTVKVLDFAQGEKVVLGGLVGLALIQADVPLPIAFALIVVAWILMGIVYDAVVIGPTLRRGPDAAIIATVGALLLLGSGHVLIWGAAGKPVPPLVSGEISIGESQVATQEFVVWGVVAVVVVLVMLFLARTRAGQGMVAAASDPMAATAVGIDVRGTRVIAMSMAFALAGLAGLLIAPITLAGGTIGAALTLKAFTAAILGGLESTHGVVIGALLLGIFESVLGGQVPYTYRDPMVFAVLIAVLLFLPHGIFGRRARTV